MVCPDRYRYRPQPVHTLAAVVAEVCRVQTLEGSEGRCRVSL